MYENTVLYLSKCQLHNTVLPTILNMLYIWPSNIIYLWSESPYLFISFFLFSQTFSPWLPPFYCFCEFDFFQLLYISMKYHAVFVFSIWLILLSMMSFRFIHIYIYFFFCRWQYILLFLRLTNILETIALTSVQTGGRGHRISLDTVYVCSKKN